MKRLSARPFVVEIKNQPRPSRTLPPVVTRHDRIESGLWHGLLTGADTAPVPEARPPVGSAPPPPGSRSGMDAPAARRILPNLMSSPAPDAIVEPPEPVAAPKARRRGPSRSAPSAAASVAADGPAAEPAPTVAVEPTHPPEIDPRATGPVAYPPAPAIRVKPARRRPEVLRPGERWKRRLSRFSR